MNSGLESPSQLPSLRQIESREEIEGEKKMDERHVDIVTEMLRVNGETSLVKNLDGMTALHVAVIKGQALVLSELVRIRPELLRVPTDQGETALHLSVKWNRVEALKVLVEETMNLKELGDLVNSKDCEGNTVLHIAVSEYRLEIVNYLLTLNGFQVNALNNNKLTALDILLTQSPRDMEIEHALRNAGASSANDLHIITHDWFLGKVAETPSSQESATSKTQAPASENDYKPIDWLSILFAKVSLFATAAFHAGVSLSGIWSTDKCVLDESGLSVLSFTWQDQAGPDPMISGMAMLLDAVVLGPILVGICYVVSKVLLVGRRWWMGLQIVIMWIAVGFQFGLYIVICVHMIRQCKGRLPKITYGLVH